MIEVAKRIVQHGKDYTVYFYGILDKSYSLEYFSKLEAFNIHYKDFLELTKKRITIF